MCSGPGHLNFAWGSLDVYSVALDFLCACLHEPLGWPGFYWSFAGFLSAQSRYCNESAL